MPFDGFGSSAERPQISGLEVAPTTDHEPTPLEAERAAQAEEAAKRAKEEKERFLEVTPASDGAEVVPQDPLLIEIDKALQADLAKIVEKNFPTKEDQDRFIHSGRDLAQTLFVGRKKMDPEHVVSLIRAWLLQIPSASKNYLEQVSKNKADAILKAVHQAADASA